MKIGFIFASDFNVATVFQAPLGGSESAVSYLAIELAKLGHNITLFSLNKNPVNVFGVRCLSFSMENNDFKLPKEIMENDFQVFIIKNGIPHFGNLLKAALPYPCKVIFWTGHASNQPAIQDLVKQEVVAGIDGIVCVSSWHRVEMIKNFNLPANKVHICRNAIAPFFENLFLNEAEFVDIKSKFPMLAYTSTPFRGLALLLQMFPSIRAKIPSVTLNLYSSMKVYGIINENDQYQALYQLAKTTEGINYFGSLPQAKLAACLRTNTIFSYPNTFPETSCIAIMEALAAGLYIITTDLGALAETTLGFGKLIAPENIATRGSDSYQNVLQQICAQQISDPAEFLKKQYSQVLIMNKLHTWSNRAKEWISLLQVV